ncbi:21066_t:CDS:2, partial [Gigaspora rosea]
LKMTGESSRLATVKAPEETPSKLLRQLARALAQPELDQQLTPLRQKAPRRRKETLQELLRALSRAPGFVQKPQVIPHIPKRSTHHIPNNDDYVPDNDQVAEETNIEYSLLTSPGFVQKPQRRGLCKKPQVIPHIPESSIHHIPNNDNDDYVPDNDQVAEENNIEYLILLTSPEFVQKPQTNIGSSKPKEPKTKGPPQLPKSLIKKVFNNFSTAKVSKAAMQQIAKDLATYAAHGKRKIIQDKDVLLLMKR